MLEINQEVNLKSSRLEKSLLWVLISVEALLFWAFYAREIAPYPPQNFDQAVYLTQTYTLQEQVSTGGLGEFWRELWSPNHASTLALPIEGALFGLIVGGARFPQLCVLLVGFCALQIFAFSTARAVFRDRVYGIVVLGLILSQSTLWFWAGGLFDFRIDFLAYCLYGIWVCAVIRSNLFTDRRWAIACGLIGALLVLHRFLAVLYIVGVCGGFAAFCALILFLTRKQVDVGRQMKHRLLNLALMLVVFAAIVSPILFINWTTIYNKYGYAQFIYEKDIRAREFGVFSLSDNLLFYPRSIVLDHLGQSFLWASAIGFAGALLARLLCKSVRIADSTGDRDSKTVLLEIIFLLGAISGPIILLTFDISKSPVIGGIVGVPAALLVVSLIARIAPKLGYHGYTRAYKLLLASALLIFLLGVFNQFSHSSQHTMQATQRRDLKRVAELDRWLVDYANEHNWPSPEISFDVISGWFLAEAITASGYEQTGGLVKFRSGFGNAGELMGIDRSQALPLLAQSDFVLFSTLPKTGLYPFYQKISEYWHDLKDWADKNMTVARIIPFNSFTLTVYVRPSAEILNLSGDWITSRGIMISANRGDLERFPEIRLSGPANFSLLPKVPTVSAAIEREAGSIALCSSLRVADKRYEILIDASSIKNLPPDPVYVSLKYDTFFVPRELGLNADTRELVIPAPDRVELLRKP
jgi:hypothetical protein